jgi:hypothetical protein
MRFIVRFPSFGRREGQLVINPGEEETKDFTLFHLKPGKDPLSEKFGSWLDNELNGCMIIKGIVFCNPTLLDSGNPDSWAASNEVPGSMEVRPGVIVMKLSDMLDPLTMAVARLDTVSKRDRNKSFVFLTGGEKEERNIFGVRAFFLFDILYYPQNGMIGLKPK